MGDFYEKDGKEYFKIGREFHWEFGKRVRYVPTPGEPAVTATLGNTTRVYLYLPPEPEKNPILLYVAVHREWESEYYLSEISWEDLDVGGAWEALGWALWREGLPSPVRPQTVEWALGEAKKVTDADGFYAGRWYGTGTPSSR